MMVLWQPPLLALRCTMFSIVQWRRVLVLLDAPLAVRRGTERAIFLAAVYYKLPPVPVGNEFGPHLFGSLSYTFSAVPLW